MPYWYFIQSWPVGPKDIHYTPGREAEKCLGGGGGGNEMFQSLVLKLTLLSITKLLVMAEFDQLKSYYVSLREIFPFIAFIVFSSPASNKINESEGLYFKRKE